MDLDFLPTLHLDFFQSDYLQKWVHEPYLAIARARRAPGAKRPCFGRESEH